MSALPPFVANPMPGRLKIESDVFEVPTGRTATVRLKEIYVIV